MRISLLTAVSCAALLTAAATTPAVAAPFAPTLSPALSTVPSDTISDAELVRIDAALEREAAYLRPQGR